MKYKDSTICYRSFSGGLHTLLDASMKNISSQKIYNMFVECLLTIAYSRNKKSNDFFIGLQSLLKTVLIEVTEPIKNCINRGYEAY